MENNDSQKAQDALETLNFIKKVAKVTAYIILLVIFGCCFWIIHQQEQYIEQLNTKLEDMDKQVTEHSKKYNQIMDKVRTELKNDSTSSN